jgi:hypothetical protein
MPLIPIVKTSLFYATMLGKSLWPLARSYKQAGTLIVRKSQIIGQITIGLSVADWIGSVEQAGSLTVGMSQDCHLVYYQKQVKPGCQACTTSQ